MQTKLRQKGFTLVEIAIVLVIIGLLLGGILKGQEMITQARIKNVINDFNGITAAYASYQDRYRAVPGDDPRAGSCGGTPGTTPALLRRPVTAWCRLQRPAAMPLPSPKTADTFWWHLRQAGFIAGATAPPAPASLSNLPMPSGGMIGVTTGTARRRWG